MFGESGSPWLRSRSLSNLCINRPRTSPPHRTLSRPARRLQTARPRTLAARRPRTPPARRAPRPPHRRRRLIKLDRDHWTLPSAVATRDNLAAGRLDLHRDGYGFVRPDAEAGRARSAKTSSSRPTRSTPPCKATRCSSSSCRPEPTAASSAVSSASSPAKTRPSSASSITHEKSALPRKHRHPLRRPNDPADPHPRRNGDPRQPAKNRIQIASSASKPQHPKPSTSAISKASSSTSRSPTSLPPIVPHAAASSRSSAIPSLRSRRRDDDPQTSSPSRLPRISPRRSPRSRPSRSRNRRPTPRLPRSSHRHHRRRNRQGLRRRCPCHRAATTRIELQVHIADVAEYVLTGTDLDLEARLRGNSVYFPDRAVPMLPQSSRPTSAACDQRRPPRSQLPHAHRRQRRSPRLRNLRRSHPLRPPHDLHPGRRHHRSRPRRSRGNARPLRRSRSRFERMKTLALLLNKKRQRRGSIDFDLPEPVIEFDSAGAMHNIVRSTRSWANRLIEEFMLAANECVASWIEQHGVPSIYRIHEMPEAKRVIEFEETAAAFGYSLGIGALPSSASR